MAGEKISKDHEDASRTKDGREQISKQKVNKSSLLYTSDTSDERTSVEIGGLLNKKK